MASSRIPLTSKPPSSTIRTTSELSEFTSSDFEDIFETSTTESASSTSTARRPVVPSASRSTIRSASISSTSVSDVPSISSEIQTSMPTSVSPPNFLPVTSSDVSRPSSVAATSHNQNVFTPLMITIIAAGSVALVLLVVALIFLVRYRRRRSRLSRTQDAGSRDLIDPEEKYRDRSNYAMYSDSQHKDPLMEQGMTPLLNVPSIGQHSRSSSFRTFTSDVESHLYHEGPTTPFLNENERRAELNTAMYPDRAPYTFAEVGDTALDSVVLLPAVPPPIPQSRATMAASKLAPLYIAEPYKTVPPSRRRSKGKNWKRPSAAVSATASPANTDCDSDSDSASLYSQASASTHRTFTAPTRQLTNPPFHYPSTALPSIPQSPYNIPSTVASSSKLERPTGAGMGSSAANLAYISSPVESLVAREEEGNGGLGKEETILVATLLQSRLSRVPKQGLAPTRSDSVVSHIERAGSIKPVLPSSEAAGRASRYGPRSHARRTQDAVLTQILPKSDLRSGGSEYQLAT